MTKAEIIASARIFAQLQIVLGKNNAADIENAARFPIKLMTIYNKEAFARHVLTEKVQQFLSKEYSTFTYESFESAINEPLGLEAQGIWQFAYLKAKQELGAA